MGNRTRSSKKKTDEKLDDLLATTREQPGFENCLLPPSDAAMGESAQQGAMVVLNISQFRCDLIIVKPGRFNLLSLT